MLKFNVGKRYRFDYSKLHDETKDTLAANYSELSSELQKLLTTLWGHGLSTIGCCSGVEDVEWHGREEGVGNIYIGVEITPESKNKIISLLINPLKNEDFEKFDLYIADFRYRSRENYNLNNKEKNLVEEHRSNLIFEMPANEQRAITQEESDSFFKQINDVITRSVITKESQTASFVPFLADVVNTVASETVLPQNSSVHLYHNNILTYMKAESGEKMEECGIDPTTECSYSDHVKSLFQIIRDRAKDQAPEIDIER